MPVEKIEVIENVLKMMLMQVLGIDKFPCYLMKQEKNLRKWVLLLKMVLLVKFTYFRN